MVMEDDPGVAMVLEIALGDEGHRVITARDGLSGMKRLVQQPLPDIVMVDLNMPRMGGRAVIESISSSPCLRNLPVVVLTGSDTAWAEMPLPGSYSALISKPFDLNEVIKTVELLTGSQIKTA